MRTSRSALFLAAAVGVLLGLGGFTFRYGEGLSYFSEDPAACVNCHVMQDNFISWGISSHRDISCNGCHLPHDTVGKYLAKAEHGLRHSVAFTFADTQVLRTTPRSYHDLQANCIACHESEVAFILPKESEEEMSCTRCHRGAGHVL